MYIRGSDSRTTPGTPAMTEARVVGTSSICVIIAPPVHTVAARKERLVHMHSPGGDGDGGRGEGDGGGGIGL